MTLPPLSIGMPQMVEGKLKSVLNNYKKIVIHIPISIVIPAYKAEKFIEECLDSIKKQTYFSENNNFEIIVGVDACKSTLKKLKEIRSKYRNLRILMMEKNLGTYVNLNTLISECEFENILIFGADDIMLPKLIERTVEEMGSNDIVRFGFKCIDKDKNIIDDEIITPAIGANLTKKEVFNKLGGYKDWRFSADTDFMKRSEEFKTVFIKEQLFLYRRHPQCLTIDEKTGNLEIRKKYHDMIPDGFEYVKPKINKFKEIYINSIILNKKGKIELTVALPVYNSKKIVWLALESLCNQRDVDFDWELILCEEIHDEMLTSSIFDNYINRLQQVNCKKISYILLNKKVNLSKKWQIIGKHIDKYSKIFLLHAADCYSPSYRLFLSYKYIIKENVDWFDINKGYFYSFDNKKIILYDTLSNPALTNLNMAFKSIYAKNIPNTNLFKGIDGFLYKHCQNINKNMKNFSFDILLDDSLDTDGYNNISIKRKDRFKNICWPFIFCDKIIDDLDISAEIKEKIKQLSNDKNTTI